MKLRGRYLMKQKHVSCFNPNKRRESTLPEHKSPIFGDILGWSILYFLIHVQQKHLLIYGHTPTTQAKPKRK